MGNPALLRPVLKRHSRLRILLQHVGAGWSPGNEPFDKETLALLADHSTVYFDMSIVNSDAPEDVHQAKLRRLIDAGFGDRIMFGSDTRAAGPILRRLENIGWLTHRSAVPSFTTTPHAFCVSTLRRSHDTTAADPALLVCRS